MAQVYHYCGTCGAANPAGTATCFACKHSLAAEAATASLIHGRYEQLTCLGTGGYGAVYRVRDVQQPRRRLALKQINLSGLTAEAQIEATETFNREVAMLSALSNPHLPCIHDTFTDAEHWYVVMDLIEGETLEQYFMQQTRSRREVGLPLESVLEIGVQLCEVLHYLHTRQPAVIFRDLKPGNIIRNAAGRLYLIDFGIARHFTPGKTRDTIPLGSPGYAAPEQYGKAQTTPQSDLYGLGALLAFLLTGDDPADHPFQFQLNAGYGNAGITALKALIRELVEASPAQRPASAQVVKQRLERIVEQHVSPQSPLRRQMIGLPNPAGPFPSTSFYTPTSSQQQQAQVQTNASKPAKMRRRGALVALGVAGALATGWGTVTYFSSPKQEQGPSAPKPLPYESFQSIYYYHETVNSPAGTRQAIWSYDGQYLATLSDNTVRVWSIDSRTTLYTLSIGENASIAWAPNAEQLSVSTGHIVQTYAGYQQRLLSTMEHQNMWLRLLTFSPNGRYLAGVNETSNACIYDIINGNLVYTYAVHLKAIVCLAWSPDSRHMVSGDGIGNMYVWDMLKETADLRYSSPLPYGGIQAVGWSPDGKLIAMVGCDGYLVLWDSQTLRLVHKWPIDDYSLMQSYDVAWSPNSRYIAMTGGTAIINIWDSVSKQHVFKYREHEAVVNTVRWSPDGKYLISADKDGIVRIWEPELPPLSPE